MSFIPFIISCALVSQIKPLDAATMQNFDLIRRSSFSLYGPDLLGSPWSQNFCSRPLFAHLPDGETFLVKAGLAGGMAYWFKPDGELNRMSMLTPPGSSGRPGSMSGVATVFSTSSKEFGTYDNSKRLNLWDAKGNLKESFIIPLTLDSGIVVTAMFNHSILALEGVTRKPFVPLLTIVEYKDTIRKPISITFSKDAIKNAEAKGKDASRFANVQLSLLSSSKVACNVGNSADIYLVSVDGKVIKEGTVPPHYRSLNDADPFDSTWFSFDNNGRISNEAEEWFKTWTHSYPAYELSDKRLVVPRVLYPTFNLDLYSYSDNDIKYLGYASTDKEFLFADTSGVYLLESKDDTSIVVSKYEIVTPNFREDRKLGWSTMRLTAEQLTGIHKVPPDTSKSDTCKPCDREKLKPKGYCNTIDAVKLISADSVEYSLKDKLAPDKEHILIFGAPQDCALFSVIQAAKEFLKDKPDYDLTLVYTHPFPEELKEVTRLSEMDWNLPILMNLDYMRLNPILKSPACFLVVSKNGKITASAEYPTGYPDFEPKPR